MKAYIFPGQGAQFSGMGKDLYESSKPVQKLFAKANDILGFNITQVMFEGTAEDLIETKVTQPAIFLHSAALTHLLGENFNATAVAGHSLGEFSALVANKTLSFEDGLKLVSKRALAMQKACELEPSTMAAVLKLEDNIVENICSKIKEVVVAANYNCPGQLVISGSIEGVKLASVQLKEAGGRAIPLKVGGAFHSPLMEPAKLELEEAIRSTEFSTPICPIYQNVHGLPTSNSDIIKMNLISQLTSPVKWTHTINNMVSDGYKEFIEVGPGKVLQGLVKKIKKDAIADSLVIEE